MERVRGSKREGKKLVWIRNPSNHATCFGNKELVAGLRHGEQS